MTANAGSAAPLDPRALTAWLAAREDAMRDLLRELVDVDSPTADKAGVDAAGAVLRRFWASHGLRVEVRPIERHGDALFARLPARGPKDAPDAPNADARPIVLLGHRDTVFPAGEAARRPFRVENGRFYGPGVADMKGGLVVEAFVMAAFAELGGAPAPLVMLTTSDEEIASPSCRPIIEDTARGARAVLNAEPSRAESAPKSAPKSGAESAPESALGSNRRAQVVTRGRKGGVFLRADAVGVAAHSGAHYARGRSAILDLAQKVAPLHALTDLEAGVSVNVGLIGGGQTVNTVAPEAWIEIDLRYVEPGQRDAALEAIRAIVEAPAVDGVTARLSVKGEFLPLNPTPASLALLDAYRRHAATLGVDVTAEFTGGCADSGFTAAVGCPTLCSVGPMGSGGHTPDEFVEADSLVPTAQAMALTILELASPAPPSSS